MMQIVRRIDVAVRSVKWSDNGDLVAILGETSFYVLQHDREVCCCLQLGSSMHRLILAICSCIVAKVLAVIEGSSTCTGPSALLSQPDDCMQIVAAALEAGVQPDEDGIEDAFELLNEVAEHARGGAGSAMVQVSHVRCKPVALRLWCDNSLQCVLDAFLISCVTCSAGLWVGDCFIYNNSAWRLCYCVGSEVSCLQASTYSSCVSAAICVLLLHTYKSQ
jgi:coatomer subunit beta'